MKQNYIYRYVYQKPNLTQTSFILQINVGDPDFRFEDSP